MKSKFVRFTILVALALVSAACAAQEETNQPGDITVVPTVATEAGVATEEAGGADLTPTGVAEAETPTQVAGETETAPTVAADGSTPAAGESPTAGIPQTGGLPDDLDEMVRVLIEAGATVDLGEAVQNELVSVPGQSLLIDGEEVQVFAYQTAEELEAVASQLENSDPESEPRFYKLGTMLVFYAGHDPGVRDLLEDVLGAQAAGQ
jgi:hypothetical protein